MPTLPATTSTTTDPFAVPDVITLEYLDRVLAELDRIDGEATRKIVAAKALTPEAIALIESIYTEPELATRLAIMRTHLEKVLANLKGDPKARETNATELISAGPECVFLRATRDFSRSAVIPPPPQTTYIALAPTTSNRTGWTIAFDSFNEDSSRPEDPCLG